MDGFTVLPCQLLIAMTTHLSIGVERLNPDLSSNYVSLFLPLPPHPLPSLCVYIYTTIFVLSQDADGSYDYNDKDSDPSPNLKAKYDNSHGTK